jgi:hypothetical protein
MSLAESLYGKYIAEREQKQILEMDSGFISYKIMGPECFMADMYIVPEKRSGWCFRDLMKEIERTALSQGCKVLTANIDLRDQGKDHTLASALRIGFKVISANGDVLLIAKKIRED